MKSYFLLVAVALSSTAWAAGPGTNTMPANKATAPMGPSAKPEAAPAASSEQKAVQATGHEAAPAAASEQKAAQATSEQAGFSRGSVVRSVFTTEVKDREPIDKLNNNKSSAEHIYFFTELRDMSGQTAIHRWEHDGKVAAEVKFKVRGPRWRVWSSKTFSPGATGEWKVSVLNGAGEVIAEDMIDYTGSAAAQHPASTEKPATEDESAPTLEQPPAAPTNVQ